MKTAYTVVRQPLVDIVIERLRQFINERHWKVGERIPNESELCKIFDVGRNTIREAIRVLSYSGMLDVRQGDGTYVRSALDPSDIMRSISKSSLKDHLEVQYILESEAAAISAVRRNQNDLDLIRDALDKRKKLVGSSDPLTFIISDMHFHATIINATHNQAMIALYAYFKEAIRENRQYVLALEDIPEPDQIAHEKLYQAIVSSDPEAAQYAVRKMLKPMIDALTSM